MRVGRGTQGVTKTKQIAANLVQNLPVFSGLKGGENFPAPADFFAKNLFGASNSQTLAMQQIFNEQRQLNIPSPVKALVGSTLYRSKGREFGFPITQHMSFDAGQFSDFADFEIQLVGNLGVHGVPLPENGVTPHY